MVLGKTLESPLAFNPAGQQLPLGRTCQGPPRPAGIFLTQELNLGLLHGRQILYHLSHQGSTQGEVRVNILTASRMTLSLISVVLMEKQANQGVVDSRVMTTQRTPPTAKWKDGKEALFQKTPQSCQVKPFPKSTLPQTIH